MPLDPFTDYTPQLVLTYLSRLERSRLKEGVKCKREENTKTFLSVNAHVSQQDTWTLAHQNYQEIRGPAEKGLGHLWAWWPKAQRVVM